VPLQPPSHFFGGFRLVSGSLLIIRFRRAPGLRERRQIAERKN
jgi:hypothetical protein